MHYFRNCHTCQHSHTNRQAPRRVLRPLAVPDKPLQHILMDFVTALPSSKRSDVICVIIDWFTKHCHLITCTTMIDTEGFAELFIREVFRRHGLPQTAISKRGPQFIVAFWKCLCKRLDIQERLSSPYNPQTDGKTERLNAVMEQYLQCYVNYLQDDWTNWLPLAEFAVNNQESESTKVFPFFANTWWDPRISTDLNLPARGDINDTRAPGLATRMAEIHKFTMTNMNDAPQRYHDLTDKQRTTAPQFRPGDVVWFLSKNPRSV